MRFFKDIRNHRSILQIKTALLGTTFWGATEPFILSCIGWIDRHIWPNFHSLFMRILHGQFGGIVTPSTIELEKDHSKRNWENRTLIEKYVSKNPNPKGVYLHKGDVLILPNEEVISLLLRSKMRVDVGYCFCRRYAEKHGHKCELNAPIWTCMSFSMPQSIEDIRESEPRQDLIAKEQDYYNLLKKCEEIGLVHQVIFFQQNSTYVVCNCCPDCCEVLSNYFSSLKQKKYHQTQLETYQALLKKIKDNPHKIVNDILDSTEIEQYNRIRKNLKNHKRGAQLEPTPIVVKSAFISKNKSEQNCINCGKCESRCYFGARTLLNKRMQYNPDLCVGCGLCVTTCPQNAILLERRPFLKQMAKNGKGTQHIHPHGYKKQKNKIKKII